MEAKRRRVPLGELDLDISSSPEKSFSPHPFPHLDDLDIVVDTPTSESRFRAALAAFPTQSQSLTDRTLNPESFPGELRAPRNPFETALSEAGMQVRRVPWEDGEQRLITFIVGNANHVMFSRKLDEVLSRSDTTKTEALIAFEGLMKNDADVDLFLSPSKSALCGVQDTAMRALLLTRSAQAEAFDILMRTMRHYAYSAPSNKRNAELAAICIAHVRYLDSVFSSRALFDSVFRWEIELWRSPTREALVEALSEIIADRDTQQDVVLNLQEMFVKDLPVTQHGDKLRLSILRALSMMQITKERVKPLRAALLRQMNKVPIHVLPELIRFCLQSVCHGDEKGNQFRNVLARIATNLDLQRFTDTVTTSANCKSDAMVRVFEFIAAGVHAGGHRGTKAVMSILTNGESDGDDDEEEDEEDEENDDDQPAATVGKKKQKRKVFDLFDILLCVSLLTADDESLSKSLIVLVKRQVTTHANRRGEAFNAIFHKAVTFKAFGERYLREFLALAEQLLWACDEAVVRVGASMYKRLFLARETRLQEEVMLALIRHVNWSGKEATAVLGVLKDLVENHMQALLPYSVFIQGLFDSIYELELHNVRTLFQILVAIYTRGNDQGDNSEGDFMISMNKFLCSGKLRESAWGVIGMLIHLQEKLKSKHLDDAAKDGLIVDVMRVLDERGRGSVVVRRILYEELAGILDVETIARPPLVAWCEQLLARFQNDFFSSTDRRTRTLHMSALMAGGESRRVEELIPLFYLLVAFARVGNAGMSTQTAIARRHEYLLKLKFAIEAEIMIVAGEGMNTQAECDAIFYAIEWIRTLLNVFAHCDPQEIHEQIALNETIKEKFALMCALQRRIVLTIKNLHEYRLPRAAIVDEDHRRATVVFRFDVKLLRKTSEKKKGVKKEPGKSEAKKTKEREKVDKKPIVGRLDNEDDDEDADLFGDDENPDEPGPSKRVKRVLFPRSTGRKTKTKQLVPAADQVVDVDRFLQFVTPMQLVTATRLIQLIDCKPKRAVFVMDELLKAVKIVMPAAESGKHGPPFLQRNQNADGGLFNCEKLQIVIGEQSIAQRNQYFWHAISTALPSILQKIHSAYQFFETPFDGDASPAAVSPSMTAPEAMQLEMAGILEAALRLVAAILTCDDIRCKSDVDSDDSADSVATRASERARVERRRKLMEIGEHAILQMKAGSEGGDDAEVAVFRYFMKVADAIPTVACATGILQVLVAFELTGFESERDKAAKLACEFLKREWWDIGDKRKLTGQRLNAVTKTFVQQYIRLRAKTSRLLAMQWLVANPLAALMPEPDRRKSQEFLDRELVSRGQRLNPCRDTLMQEEGHGGKYACLDGTTFSTVHRVVLTAMNNEVLDLGEQRGDECFVQWKYASSIFTLLGMMLRAPKLRNNAMLLTAVREGRRFLCLFSRGFLRQLEGKRRLARFAPEANGIIKVVQQGNRQLQNIASYARNKKAPLLLRMLPELRAASERFMRNVHSTMIREAAGDAFSIDLLRSRDIDGNFIEPQLPNDEMADDDGEGENARAHSDDEEGEDDGEDEDGDAAGGDSEQAGGNEDGEDEDGNHNGAHGGEEDEEDEEEEDPAEESDSF